MSQAKGPRQSDASQKLGQNSTVGQTVANARKEEENLRLEQMRAQQKKKKPNNTGPSRSKLIKEQMAKNQKLLDDAEKARKKQLLEAMPMSEEQIAAQKELAQRRASLNRALKKK